MPSKSLFKLAQRNLKIRLKLPFPYCTFHNPLFFNSPALLIRPALGNVDNASFIQAGYDALKESVINPLDIISVTTENMKHLTFNDEEVGPFLTSFSYEVFAKRRSNEKIQQEMGLDKDDLAKAHSGLMSYFLTRSIAKNIVGPIESSRLASYESLRRYYWKLETKALKLLNQNQGEFTAEKQRLERCVEEAMEEAMPQLLRRRGDMTKAGKFFFNKEYGSELTVETMDRYIQELFN